MPDSPQDVATLRARLAHHAGTKAAAEAERARIIGTKAEAGARLSDEDIDAIDIEISRLVGVIERATSRVDLLRPALARAERTEAEAAAQASTTAERAAFAEVAAGALAAHGPDLVGGRSMAQAVLGARGPVVSDYSPALFDERPAPRFSYGDSAEWWEAREARLRAEGRASDAARR